MDHSVPRNSSKSSLRLCAPMPPFVTPCSNSSRAHPAASFRCGSLDLFKCKTRFIQPFIQLKMKNG